MIHELFFVETGPSANGRHTYIEATCGCSDFRVRADAPRYNEVRTLVIAAHRAHVAAVRRAES